MAYQRKKKAGKVRAGGKPTRQVTGKGGKKVAGKKPAVKTGRRTIQSREGGERLNKYLAEHGIASRRAADELILEGHVYVDGVKVEELGLRVDPEEQEIEVDGELLVSSRRERKRYYLLNKPTGVVCTNERRETRPRAVDLITDRDKGRIYTVGRLDEESKGLILLTNDGDFANRIMHPSFGVAKTYMVKLRGRISDDAVQKVREGVYLAEGRTGSARVVIRKRTRDYSHLMVTLREGKNREIRRVFHSVGFQVVDLRRSRIGSLDDRGLKVGFWRPLTRSEVAELIALSNGDGGDAAAAEEVLGRGGAKRAKKAKKRSVRRESTGRKVTRKTARRSGR